MTYPIHFRIKRCKGLDGCEQMGLDDELATSLVENIAKQHMTSSVNNMAIHMRSSSCDLTHMCQHQHAIVTCCDMASSTNNHAPTALATTTTHRPMTMHVRLATTLPHTTSYKFTRLKRPRLLTNVANCPTHAHDRLTTMPTTRNDHNDRQTTTRAHEQHQRPPPAHLTAPAL